MTEYYRSSATKNFLWKFLENCGAQCVSFIVTIILAQLLDPEAYGIISIVTVFTSILSIFISAGMGSALIQKKDSDDLDFSTLFYFNIVLCVTLYVLLFFTAPLIAFFYQEPQLTALLRVCGLSLIISGIRNIQNSFVTRNLVFKRFFYATLIGTIVAALVGIIMAFYGFGVWALVAQQLVREIINTIVLWCTVNWRPKRMFSVQRLRILFSYGWKLLFSEILNTVSNSLNSLIIGKKYTSADLAFYNKGTSLPDLVVNNINSALDSILFPLMSREQDNKQMVRNMIRRSIKICTFFIFPLLTGIAICGDHIFSILYPEKWMPTVSFLRIFCVVFASYPLNSANISAAKAIGRSDLVLKMQFFKKSISITITLFTMWISPLALALGLAVSNLISIIISTIPSSRYLRYGLFSQLKDILPTILLCVIMGIAVQCVNILGLSDYLTLLIQIPLGIAIYVGAAYLLKLEDFTYSLELVRGFLNKKDQSSK